MSKGSRDETQWNIYTTVKVGKSLLSLLAQGPVNTQGKQDWSEK